jgi:hypothetical protein
MVGGLMMNKRNLPALDSALRSLYDALDILCTIDGTLKITDPIVDVASILEQIIIELENNNE